MNTNHKIFLPDEELYEYGDGELADIFQSAVDTLSEEEIFSFKPRRNVGEELPFFTQSQLDLFQHLWHGEKEPFILATRRMGKTHLSVKFCFLFLLYAVDGLTDEVIEKFDLGSSNKINDLASRAKTKGRGVQVIHTFPSQEQANNNLRPEIDDLLIKLEKYKFIKPSVKITHVHTEEYVKITNIDKHSTFRYSGCQINPDNLRGGGCDILILDEIQNVAKETIDRIITPFLRDTGGIKVHVGTALSNRDLIQMAKDAAAAPNKAYLVKTLWDQYRYGEASKWEILSIVIDNPVKEAIFKNEYECDWRARFEDSILKRFKFRNFDIPPNSGYPYMISMDLGRKDAYVVLVWRYTNYKELILIDGIIGEDKTTEEMIKIVSSKPEYEFIDQIIVPHDATQRTTKTRNTDKGLWSAAEIAGRVLSAKSNAYKRNKAEEVRLHKGYLKNVYVNSTVPDDILLHLKNWQYDIKDTKQTGRPAHDENSHVGDAWLYGIATFFNKEFQPIDRHNVENPKKSAMQKLIDDAHDDGRITTYRQWKKLNPS